MDLFLSRGLPAILLLIVSNTFMTLAWYGHLKFKTAALLMTILVSWMIALPEYLFQVPANRMGSDYFTPAQLKVMQEVITLGVFVVFNFIYFQTAPDWRMGVASLLIVAAVVVIVSGGSGTSHGP